jgi:membrane protein DedA with SNARE-associated domain
VDQIRGHVLLFVAVTVGSAIPFVPTGEMVSGSSALAANSRLDIFLIFLVTWAASVLGDTLLLIEARLAAGRLRPWLARRKYYDRVQEAEGKLHRNAFSAVVTGRLVPGGRAPVIIALGVGRFSVRRFVLYNTVACGLWALIYSTIGSIGGKISDHRLLGMIIAIAFAVSMSVIVQQIIRLVQYVRARSSGTGIPPAHIERPSDVFTDLTYLNKAEQPVEIHADGAPSVPLEPHRQPEMRSARSRKPARRDS